MAYFYGIHYSDASCGLSRRVYIPRYNDVLVPLFCRCVGDPNCRKRATIIRELGLSGDKRAVPVLLHALNDPAEHVRQMAASALGNLGDERAVEPLIQKIRSGRAGVSALYALSAIGSPKAINCLCEVLANNKSEHMREQSGIALGWVKPKRTSVAALKRAYHSDAAIRVRIFSACALELGNHDQGCFQFLADQLDSQDLQARRAAAECVCFRLGIGHRTTPLIIQTLRDDDEETAWYAWEELDKHFSDGTITYSPRHENFKAIADEYEAMWEKVKGQQ